MKPGATRIALESLVSVLETVRFSAGSTEGSSVGDLDIWALYKEGFPPWWFLMKETVLDSKLFIGCSSGKLGAYHLPEWTKD